MKKILALFFLLCVGRLEAQIITASVTVTNQTTNGQTITVNGNVRTWTNNVSNAAIQIATNSAIGGVATNLFNAYAVTPETSPRIQIQAVGTNQVNFISLPGSAMVVSLSTNAGVSWGNVTFSTNSLTNLIVLRGVTNGAITQIGASERTNAENSLVGYLNDNAGTNIVTSNAPALIGYMTTNSPQTNWNKTEIQPTIIGGTINTFLSANGVVLSVGSLVVTNAVSFNQATITLGIVSQLISASEQIANPSTTTVSDTIGGPFGMNTNLASYTLNSVLVSGVNSNGAWFGPVVLTNVSGNPNFTGNVTFNSTNTFTSPIAITAGANSSLVTGGNNIAAGTNGYLSLSGPLLAFTIYGISGGYEGLYLTLENDDAAVASMTLANESGLASAAANRIRTGYNADQTYTNSPGVVTLRYNGTLSRWVVQSSNK